MEGKECLYGSRNAFSVSSRQVLECGQKQQQLPFYSSPCKSMAGPEPVFVDTHYMFLSPKTSCVISYHG